MSVLIKHWAAENVLAKLGSDFNSMMWTVSMKIVSTEPGFKLTMQTAG